MEHQNLLRELALYFFGIFAFGEFVIGMLSAGRTVNKRDSLANLSIWLINVPWARLVTGGVFLGVLGVTARFSPWVLPINFWTIILTFFVQDFIYYWFHRLEHDVRLLWTFHSVHHSSEEFNFGIAIRNSWLTIYGEVIFYIPAVLLGLNPTILLACRSLTLLYGYWLHTERIGKLGWFDRFFNSPSNHRVHHASNKIYLDRNHSGILMIWDRMFGTFQEELDQEPVIYGLTKPLKSYNPVVINFHETVALIRDIGKAKSIFEALKFIFRDPGWAPARREINSDAVL